MRVLVCGTNYGASYIRALSGAREHITLAGILSNGSARSRTYAQRAQVAHYVHVDEISGGDIDLACVAVPGDAGHRLALALLDKGIHVICEHPVGPAQMRAALTVAQSHGLAFQVNAHFADLLAPQAFYRGLNVAKQLGPVLHYELALNLRTLYSGLDLLARSLGSHVDWEVVAPIGAQPAPFESILLTSTGLRVSLLCQNFSSANDDGSATLLNHRCSATFAHGNLLLAESNGPVLWFPSPVSMAPQHWRNYLPLEMAQLDGPQLQLQRDHANWAAILQMAAVIQGQAVPAHQHPDYLLALAALWERVLFALQPALTAPAQPAPESVEPLSV